MGYPLDVIGYGEGLACPTCFGIGGRWEGGTPEFITATIVGVGVFDGIPDDYPGPPSGGYLLTQDPFQPCVFGSIGVPWSVTLRFSHLASTTLLAQTAKARPIGFRGVAPILCARYFQNVTLFGVDWYTGGTAMLS